MKKIILFIIVLFIAQISLAAPLLPKQSLVPGGIAILKLPKNVRLNDKVYFQKHRVMVIARGQSKVAVLGIPLAVKIGKNAIQIRQGKKITRVIFKVHGKKYPASYIRLKHRKYVAPKKSFLDELKQQQKIINHAFSHWRDKKNINMHFSWPVKGRISGRFGFQRYYNGKKRSQHRGIDIAAKRGTYVRSPAAGRVIQEGYFYFTGKTVFVDHGQNLITVYAHLNRILVKQGQVIKRRQIIGTVGSTGRSTGPHLHWGVSLNNTRVNPRLFL